MVIKMVVRKFIAIILSVFVVFLIYYGSYLPLRKSKLFIKVMRDVRKLKDFDEIKEVVSAPFDAPSPFGQEELVRSFSNILVNFVQQNDNPRIIVSIVEFLNGYYAPIIERNKGGLSFEQDLYILGMLNELAFIKITTFLNNNEQKLINDSKGDPSLLKELNDLRDIRDRYFLASKSYYLRGHELGPNRPQPLYGLFDIYRFERNVEKTKETADKILKNWPDDVRTKEILEDFLKREARR